MVSKVTISLPDELLAALDAEAEALGASRSSLVQEATARYLEQSVEERTAEARRRRIRGAIDGMKAIRDLPGDRDPRPGVEIIHEMREERMRRYFPEDADDPTGGSR